MKTKPKPTATSAYDTGDIHSTMAPRPKTKPKPTAFLGNRAKKYATATIAGTPDPTKQPSLAGRPLSHVFDPDELDKFKQPMKTRPKTAPNNTKRVKTRAAPPDPPKTGWIAIEDRKPPRNAHLVYGGWHGNTWMKTAVTWPFSTHWIALPTPPERKSK